MRLRHLAVPLDTTPEAARVQADGLRRFTPERRLGMALEMSELARKLSPAYPKGGLSPRVFVLEIVKRLNKTGTSFMVIGALAAAAHGHPRTTLAVDVFLDTEEEEQIQAFIGSFGDLFSFVGYERIHDRAHGFEARLDYLDNSRFGCERFARRCPLTFEGEGLYVESSEDVVLTKLWLSAESPEKHLRDALNVAITQAEALDRAYLRKWAAELGVAAKLEEVLTEADRFLTPGAPG